MQGSELPDDTGCIMSDVSCFFTGLRALTSCTHELHSLHFVPFQARFLFAQSFLRKAAFFLLLLQRPHCFRRVMMPQVSSTHDTHILHFVESHTRRLHFQSDLRKSGSCFITLQRPHSFRDSSTSKAEIAGTSRPESGSSTESCFMCRL